MLRRVGPREIVPTLRLDVLSVPNGRGLRGVVEVRDSDFANAPITWRGESRPFDLEPDVSVTLDIEVRPVEAPETDGPPPPDLSDVRYVRAPWGSTERPAEAFAQVIAPAGVIGPGRSLALFDGPTIAASRSSGSEAATRLALRGPDESGGLQVDLPAPSEAPAVIYAALVDAEGRVSDADPDRPGLQAAPLGQTEWIASMGRKVRGTSFPNPHSVVVSPLSARSPRRLQFASEVSQAELDALTEGLAEVRVQGARSWRRFEDADGPPQRAGQAVTYDPLREEVVVFGGFDPGDVATDETWLWDGETWRSVTIDIGPTARSQAAMAFFGPLGRALLFGGAGQGQLSEPTLWGWDGAQWSVVPQSGPGPEARLGHALGVDPIRGRLVMFGGQRDDGTIVDELWEFDGRSWLQVPKAEAWPAPRVNADLVWDPVGERLILAAGSDSSFASSWDLWSWDGVTWEELETSNPSALGTPTGAVFDEARGRLLVLDAVADFVSVFSWSDGEWLEQGPDLETRPEGRTEHSFVYDPIREESLLWGGTSREEDDRTWSWNGVEWRIRDRRDVLRAPDRYLAGSALVPDRRVLAFGGFDAANQLTNDTWELTDTGWNLLTSAQDTPSPRVGVAMAYHAVEDVVVMFGGVVLEGGRFAFVDETWTWNRSEWVLQTRGADDPSPRAFAQMAFDSERGQLVLFGGETGTATPDTTFVWDASGWREIVTPPESTPEPRQGHGLVEWPACAGCDEPERGVNLVGGVGFGNRLLEDHWVWRGDAWERTPHGFLNGADAALGYDPVGDRLLAFGGTRDRFLDPVFATDTLRLFRGDGWVTSVVFSAPPPRRTGAIAAYDEVAGAFVVASGRVGFAGDDASSQTRTDTWFLRGRTWEEATVAGRPRCQHAAAWHPETGEVIMSGGTYSPGSVQGSSSTWRWGPAGWEPSPSREILIPSPFATMAAAPEPGTFLMQSGVNPRPSWLWREGAWIDLVPDVGGLQVRSGAMAYDSVLRRTVLHGGGIPSAVVWGGTAVFNGTSFRPLTEGGPSARLEHAMAFDARQSRMVLHGGATQPRSEDTDEVLSDETWFLEGDVWVRGDAIGGPGPRARHAMTYDPVRQRVILFGGDDDGSVLRNETWEHGPDGWQVVPTVGSVPSGRVDAVLVFDGARSAVVLDGGAVAASCLDETWLLPSGVQDRPVAQFEVALSASGLEAEALDELTIEVVARAVGSELDPDGEARPRFGYAVDVFDAWQSRWLEVATHQADAEEDPELLQANVRDAELLRRMVSGEGVVFVRVRPLGAWSTGTQRPELTLSAIEASFIAR